MRDVTKQRQVAHKLLTDREVAEARGIVEQLRRRNGAAGALAVCVVLHQLAEEGLGTLAPTEARRVRELMPTYGFSVPDIGTGNYRD